MRSLAALVVASSIAWSAAPPGQNAAQSQSPTFRSATRLVPVSVVVHDGRNRPVDGLKAEDFKVLEDGKEVPISFFSVRAETQGATSASLSAMASQGRFTNRIQSPTGGGVVAIVFDQLNTSSPDQAYGRQQLVRYLQTIRSDDRVALFALTSTGMRVLYDFTRDSESLVRALERLERGESIETIGAAQQLPAPLLEGLSAFGRGTLDQMDAHFARLRGTTTTEALEVVAEYLAGVPGRKNLVWISAGFPFSIGEGGPGGLLWSNLRLETQRAARALNHSDTAVYRVDARGLVSLSTDPHAPGLVPSLAEIGTPLDGVRAVADWTGGRAYFNSNDIGRAITRAVDDSRQTYILGYYPPNARWDERFRRIDVKVRRSGLQVRHREGYFAIPPVPHKQSGLSAISAAVLSPLEATAVPIDVAVTPDGQHYRLAVRIDPGAIGLETTNGKWSGELTVAVAQLLAARDFVRGLDRTLPLGGDDRERQHLLTDGVQFSETLNLRPDTRQVRIVVRDLVTGSIGSVFIDADRIRRLEGGSSTLGPDTSR